MSNTIYNPDGSVYMTFPPARPSSGDLQGWYVRTLSSVDVNPHHERRGTYTLSSADCESLSSLLRHVRAFNEHYGKPADVRGVRVGEGTYRWAWEHVYPDGHRVTDVIYAERIK